MAWLYKRGGKWWLGWRIGKQQFLKSTGETDHAEAKKQIETIKRLEVAQRANALSEDFYKAATGKTITRSTVASFCTAWLTDSESVTTRSTITKYRHVVGEFCEHIRADSTGILMEDVTVDHVSSFLAEMRQRLAPGTVKGYRRILSSVFLLAQNQGKIKGNPVALAKGRGKKSEDETIKKRPFTLVELKTLLNAASPFWRYMITAGFYTGQSLGDLITLRTENVDLGAGQITMHRRKTGKQVIIPISDNLRKLLVSIWPKKGRGHFWPAHAERYLKTAASSFSQEFYDLMAGAGMVVPREIVRDGTGKGRSSRRTMQKLGFHNLRHTFVTHLKLSGAVDSVARELAGHSSNAVNMVYTHLPLEALTKAVNQLPTFNSRSIP